MDRADIDAAVERMAAEPLDGAIGQTVVLWHCPNGEHPDFRASVQDVRRSFTRGGQGCAKCSVAKRRPRTPTATVREAAPEVADMMLTGDPDRLGYGSRQVVTFRCANDPSHVFDRPVVRVWLSVVKYPTASKACPTCKSELVSKWNKTRHVGEEEAAA